jgi:uncharacterized protein YoxC
MLGLRAYLSVAVLVILVGTGVFAKHLWNQNRILREKNEAMGLQMETIQDNAKLLVQQLDREAENRQNAEAALNELMQEVPDVVYSQSLPPEIQGVLDRFHSRIGRVQQ